jgi:ParB/RepB/Spo0J family partition protein
MARRQKPETGLVSIQRVPLDSITPSPVNDSVYRPPSADDPDIQDMARSMREHGVLQPLTVTRDGFILSGHRRYCAATLAGLETVPVVVENITRDDPTFPRLLVTHNQQRQKNVAELLAEQVVQRSGEDAHRELVQHRIARSRKATAGACAMVVDRKRSRSTISPAKKPMLDAVLAVVEELREFWPLSLRTIHYNLLNNPPLKHARRPASRYANDKPSYKNLSELCTRARFEGLLSFDAIHDPTRPVTNWHVFRNAGDYIREQFDEFLYGYARDFLQSQPDHIEVIGEKNTLLPIIKPVCSDYTVPLTIGRGFCSVPPRKQIYDRWRASGKNRLVLIVLSDHDPDGEMIADSLVGYLRDDFAIPLQRIMAIRAALTRKQCIEYGIPIRDKPKPKSKNYKRFVDEYGNTSCELEAVPPRRLQQMLRDAIDSVLDLDAYKAEQERELADAAEIDTARARALAALGPMVQKRD